MGVEVGRYEKETDVAVVIVAEAAAVLTLKVGTRI